MKITLRLEEAAMLVFGCFFYSQTVQPWWIFLVFFLAPDVGLLGYLVNSKTGALTYNLLHHKGIAVAAWTGGMLINNSWLEVAGIIMFAHASFDRMLGYGLKYADNFHHTHTGMIGLAKMKEARDLH